MKMHVLAPSPWGGILVRMVSCGMVGMAGVVSRAIPMIGACICSNDVNMCDSAHCWCVVNGSVAMAAF